ncbi:MAG: hypothetical protein HOM14_19155 [Gammaproteobacteria bacterium]|jgi:hypothetical protein|nr:hypothetical protein [Gammaproteobacteria bacterium]MBT3725997.1 hypothetical protein [Gammaproteobacteria bacterium]MBT4075128.1 hypothetical protein [Gammaproteobacteria bacterium]MBT4195270.1 hypothetical protein [Gammaproteobacteria bacterium]MBT4448613.1 hypothetical protein [Gammaproteobacteria bacterium]
MNEKVKKNSYKPLWILLALSAFPYLAGTLYYQFKDDLPQTKMSNYGTLVEPAREIRDVQLRLSDGSEKPFTDYQKKWLMIYVLDDECSEGCLKNIYYMRQIRKAMAQERFRINRLMILDNQNIDKEQLEKIKDSYPGMDIATVSTETKQHFYSTIQQGSGSIFKKIMLIDPFGNYMMEYTQEPDPEKVLKDVKRLLSISRIG